MCGDGEETLDLERKKEERLCEGRNINTGSRDGGKRRNKVKGITKRLGVFNEMGIKNQKKMSRKKDHV
jgi:hypothetical protein